MAFDVTEISSKLKRLSRRNVTSSRPSWIPLGRWSSCSIRWDRIARFNRACERTTGYAADEVTGRHVWDLFVIPDELDSFTATFAEIREGATPPDFETHWLTRNGAHRRIAWSSTILPDRSEAAEYIILTGIDITERRRLQKTVLDISAQEARRIGQDLHDGLGQHLTGIAFMSKVLERKLAESSAPESADADTILKLVNEAINKTRELARGLRPVVSDAEGLMSALQRVATEVSDLFKISCQFDCDEPVLINDVGAATHLYPHRPGSRKQRHQARQTRGTIARDAVEEIDDAGTLTIHDDGVGFPAVPGERFRHGSAHHAVSREHDRRNPSGRQRRSRRHARQLCVPFQDRE